MNLTILNKPYSIINSSSKFSDDILCFIDKPDPIFPRGLFSLEQRQNGAFMILILFAVYLLILAEHVCNSYFMPSIEYLSFEKLNLSSHVAGATILASASSSSELCTSFVGLFFARNDISINTLIGAGSFNLLVITTICCFCVYNFETKLYKYQILRDFLFYSLNLIVILFFLVKNGNKSFYWYQGLICILIYVLFVLVNIFDSNIRKFFANLKENIFDCFLLNHKKEFKVNFQEDVEMIDSNKKLKMFQVINKNKVVDFNIDHLSNDYNEPYDVFQPYKEFKPLNFSKKFKLVFVLPARLFAFFTIVDFRRFEARKDQFLFVTIITSLFLIGLCSYLIVWIVISLCETFEISESIIGFTFLAAATSIEESITSIALCKRELRRIRWKKASFKHLNMALSNCIGSNLFDLSIGIGFPYLINSLMFSNGTFYTSIYTKNISVYILGLLVCIVIFIFLLILFNWQFSKYLGFLTLALWVLYSSLAVSIELNVLKFDFLDKFVRNC